MAVLLLLLLLLFTFTGLLVYMFKPVVPPARISCAECNANQPMLPASTYTAISNATTDRLITWFS